MRNEFKRFGLTHGQRKLTGILQLVGSLGLLVSYFQSIYILIATAFGLAYLLFWVLVLD